MPKPIYLTEELINRYTEDFRAEVAKKKMTGGKLTYTKEFVYPEGSVPKNVSLTFSPLAYAKMWMLVSTYSTEIAWHGFVSRVDGGFHVRDIVVYPQKVTGATVETDQEAYQSWVISGDVPDEDACDLCFQGHSHVNMATTPSTTDRGYYNKIISQITDDGFYIFMIVNQSGDVFVEIYDVANNLLFETKEVDVAIAGEDFDSVSFLKDAHSKCKPASRVSNFSSYGGVYTKDGCRYYQSGYTDQNGVWHNYTDSDSRAVGKPDYNSSVKTAKKKTGKSHWWNEKDDDDDDDDDLDTADYLKKYGNAVYGSAYYYD